MSAVRSIVAQMGYTAFLAQMASHVQGGCLGSFCPDDPLAAQGFLGLGTCKELVDHPDVPNAKIYVADKMQAKGFTKKPTTMEELKKDENLKKWMADNACSYDNPATSHVAHIFPGTVRPGYENTFLKDVVHGKTSKYGEEKLVDQEGEKPDNVGTYFLEFAWKIDGNGKNIVSEATPSTGAKFTGWDYTWVQVHHDTKASAYHGTTPETVTFGYWKFTTGNVAQSATNHKDMEADPLDIPDNHKLTGEYRTLVCSDTHKAEDVKSRKDGRENENSMVFEKKDEKKKEIVCVYEAHASIDEAKKISGAHLYKIPDAQSSFLDIGEAVDEPRRDVQDIYKNRM